MSVFASSKRVSGRVAVGIVAVAAIVCTSWGFGATSARAQGATHVSAAAVSDATAARDGNSATAIAAKFGHPVVVDDLTTETNQTTAMPDGTMTLKASSVPVRTRVNGAWKSIDLDLSSSGGMLSPKTTAHNLQFSGGGSGPLARIQDASGAWTEESSPFGSLPAPKVSGQVATYANVLPDVDLRLTATVTGMSEVLIIKNAKAAANPKLAKVRFGITGSKVAADDSGIVHAGAKGRNGLRVGTPTWWDSSDGSTAAGPGDTVVPQPLAQRVTDDSVTLDVAAAASSTDVTYPMFVDPPWSAGDGHAWFIDAGFPNQAYLDNNPYANVEKSGYIPKTVSGANGVNHTARAFWYFDTPGLTGKHMISAQFTATLNSAYNCGQMRQTNLWTTSGAPIGGTWNNTIPVTAFPAVIGSATPGGCGAAVGWNALGAAQNASAGASSMTLALVAYSESDPAAWSKWNMGTSLSINYNSIPNAPASLTYTSPVRSCSTDQNNPTALDGTQKITLADTATDPDAGQTVYSSFAVYSLPSGSLAWSHNSAYQAQGQESVDIPANTLPVGNYRWDSQLGDGTDAGPLSGNCYFQIANDSPSLPTVSQTSPGTPVVGQPMTVTFGSTVGDGVRVFGYWWEDDSSTVPQAPPATTVINPGSPLPACGSSSGAVNYVCPNSGSNATGVIVAPTDQYSTLWVASYNAAGKVSNTGGTYAAASLPVTANIDSTNVSTAVGHIWDSGSLDASATSVPDSNTTSGTSGTTTRQPIDYTVHLKADSFEGIPTTDFDYSATSTVSLADRAAIDTKNSFTVSAWLHPTSSGAHIALSEGSVFNNGTQSGTGFTLGTDANGKAQFCRTSQVNQAQTCVTGPAVQLGTWTFVTGVWDSGNKQLRILFGSDIKPVAAAAQAIPAGDTSADGFFTVGASYSGGSGSANQWVGQIYRPSVFPGVVSTPQLTNLYYDYSPNDTDPPADESIGAVVNTGCDALITPQNMYDYNPNFGREGWTPDAGTPGAQAVAWNGAACRWLEEDTGATNTTIDVSVANIVDRGTMVQLQDAAAANGTAVTGEGDSAYFRMLPGYVGELTVFSGSYWITLRCNWFGSGHDGDPLPADIIANLPAAS